MVVWQSVWPSSYTFTTLYCNLYAALHDIRKDTQISVSHDGVIKWKHFPRYWRFVRGIHRFPVNSRHKGQWRGALMFSLICVWINGWVNNRKAGDLRRHRAHYDVIVMIIWTTIGLQSCEWGSMWLCIYSLDIGNMTPILTEMITWKF